MPLNQIQQNSYTTWFIDKIKNTGFQNFLENSILNISLELAVILKPDFIHYFKYYEEQQIRVNYIAPISPSEVNFSNWNKARYNQITEWANHYALNRLYLDSDNNINKTSIFLPHIFRTIECGKDPPKYQMSNGNHRFSFASENKIATILCIIEEIYILHEEWVEKQLSKLELMKKKDDLYNNRDCTYL